jgi:Cd2+/Zn2+-exporting ATPase
LKVGDLVLVNDGERIPVDGVIVEGRAVVDQSSLTGESLPQLKEVGESVFSSTLSLEGDFVMKAMRVGRDTTFDKILALVESSQQAKAPISSLADKFVNWYIFLVVLGSALIYFLTHDLRLLLSILLVTCADDLAVAIPLAFTAAIGLAAHRGVVIKGGKFLEGLDRVRTMVVDKTGTITQGKLEVKNHLVFNDFSDQDFLSLLGAMVERSNHPTARAISSFIRRQNVALAQVNDVYEESGYGIFAKFQGETVAVGRPGFVEGKGIQFSPAERETFEKEKNLGRSVIVLGKGKRVMGFISLSDSVRANAQRVMREVKNRGVKRIVMLTGDNERVAQEVAEKVGISEFKADLLPQAKLEFLKKTMVDTKGKVLMLGDGVNDAPALTLADIGCAMGAMGSEAAIESADIVLMRDDLGILPRLFDLSHYTLRVVRQDLLIWGLTNVFGLVLVFAHVIGPWGAAVFNFLTDFLPLLNSLKLFKMHLQSHSSKT